MKEIHGIKYHPGSKEEDLPDFSADFPYIASRSHIHPFLNPSIPWHWHKAVELFYIVQGSLEYQTPGGTFLFEEGSGGMLNSNVLHSTRCMDTAKECVALLHIFDPSFLGSGQGSRIEQTYLFPVTSSGLEMMYLSPEQTAHQVILEKIRSAFQFAPPMTGYEIRLRNALSEIWLDLSELFTKELHQKDSSQKKDDKLKLMMIYVHEHYSEKLSVRDIASAAFLSERECFRTFQENLHMTPADYVRSYRLKIACQMLEQGQDTITYISHACGLGSSSYFGKIFQESMHCTPSEYRGKWQNWDK